MKQLGETIMIASTLKVCALSLILFAGSACAQSSNL